MKIRELGFADSAAFDGSADFHEREGTVTGHRRCLAKPEDRSMSMFSETIARRMKLAANKELAQRYDRRMRWTREVQDRRGHSVEVVNLKRIKPSNGLLDD